MVEPRLIAGSDRQEHEPIVLSEFDGFLLKEHPEFTSEYMLVLWDGSVVGYVPAWDMLPPTYALEKIGDDLLQRFGSSHAVLQAAKSGVLVKEIAALDSCWRT